MESRKLVESDYEQLKEWWHEWGWVDPPTLDLLPENGKGGIMISQDGVNICAGFIYEVSNANIAWFTFPISNKILNKKLRGTALEFMVLGVIEICKQKGYKYIYSNLRNPSMIQHQVNNGFVRTGNNFTELIKLL